MTGFDIYFRGQLMDGASPEAARSAIGQMFRLDGSDLERLFSGKPVRIKKGVDADTAGRYRVAFRKAGALIEVVPEGAPEPAPPQATPERADATVPTEEHALQLLPPRTGSLEDCAPAVQPREIPDISWMALDLPGVTLDETSPTPPAAIDTADLSMSSPGGYSLEDCVAGEPAPPVPDTSHLSIQDRAQEREEDKTQRSHSDP